MRSLGTQRHAHVLCQASAQSRHSSLIRTYSRRRTCSVSASGDAGRLPVVNDAISLPPPATGSQYAWRQNWGGSSSTSAGGNGGNGAGRTWQARTRDWGRGPNSGVLFFILYRMRLLLLYGVWVTVLYGAFRAVADLTTAAGKAGYQFVNKAADFLYGTSSTGAEDGSSNSSSNWSEDLGTSTLTTSTSALTASSTSAALHTSPQTDSSVPHRTAGSQNTASADAVTAAAAASASASTSSSTSSTDTNPGNRLRSRPTVTVFENMMSAVIPVYLMLLGSVVFFASM